MPRRLLTVTGWAVALITGCAGGSRPLNETERVALADSVRAFANLMVETIDRHDVEGFINFHARSDDVAWAMSGSIITVDSMRASMLQYFPSPAGVNVHFRLGDARVYILDRNAAVVTAVIHSTNVDSTGVTRTGHQAWSMVLQLVQVHESYPAAPPTDGTG
jgi:hypothetical protein